MKDTKDIVDQRKKRIEDYIKSKEYIPLKEHELCLMLDVPPEERHIFEGILQQLINEGKIVRTKKNSFIPAHMSSIRMGVFSGSGRDFGFVHVDGMDEDIMIPADFINGALHTDTVMVKITEKNNGRMRGKVESIVSRGMKEIIGTYQHSRNSGFVVPDNRKIGRDIFIPKGSGCGAVDGSKVAVKVTGWPTGQKNPEGLVLEVIGHINEPGTDLATLLRQYSISTEFNPAVLRAVESIQEFVTQDECNGRIDLRQEMIFTIDGEDTKDIDDAVSVEKLENGNYSLGVHIADVTHYVREKTALDKEAVNRSTSIYLIDKVIPMLPPALSNGICSLNEGVDRLALSCKMEIDAAGKVVGHSVFESVICSKKKMTYGAVNRILTADDDAIEEGYEEFIPALRMMGELSVILRKIRMNRGAIDFDFKECKITLDENGTPIDIRPYERNMATHVIEEFMLVCNETIAEDYYWQEMPFIFRSHERPDDEKIEWLSEFLANFGYTLKGKTVHPKEMQKILSKTSGTPEEHIIARVLLRALKQARYTDTNKGHFGLNAKYYCHFTSPIRRYPDLQIHRIIKENIHGLMDSKRINKLKKILPDIAKKCSVSERVADEVERELEKAKKAAFMYDKIGMVFDGMISGVTGWGMYVELPNTVEGLVSVYSLFEDCTYYEKEMMYIENYSGKRYRIGDKVRVEVAGVDLATHNIDFTFVDFNYNED